MAGTTTIYVTKNSEAMGIIPMKAEIDDVGNAWLVSYRQEGHADIGVQPGEYHLTFSEAAMDAEQRRSKLIASLEKQIATLRSLDLSKPVEG